MLVSISYIQIKFPWHCHWHWYEVKPHLFHELSSLRLQTYLAAEKYITKSRDTISLWLLYHFNCMHWAVAYRYVWFICDALRTELNKCITIVSQYCHHATCKVLEFDFIFRYKSRKMFSKKKTKKNWKILLRKQGKHGTVEKCW